MTDLAEKPQPFVANESSQSPEGKIYTGPDYEELHSIARSFSRTSSMNVGASGSSLFDNNDPSLDPKSSEFNATKWAHVMYKIFRSDPDRYPQPSLGVSFKNLTAYGQAADVNYQLSVGNLPVALFEKGMSWLRESRGGSAADRVEILKSMDGVLNPGELLMVLGRPGAGCSTFLRTMASQTHGFKLTPESVINYHGIAPKEIAKSFRGDVTYCPETELHFPNLTVGQTLQFASRLNTPTNRIPGVSKEEYATYMRDVIMAVYGLSHTINTRVGNDLIRGVSGGERKRVSIAELSLAGASLQCWDNSTRGLDAATANEFVKTLLSSAKTFGSASLVAVYQASEEMYEMFHRVVVLYEGYQIYYGPISKARQFFIDQGWQPKPRQSTPDFLTSLSQPTEREPIPGMEKIVPRSAKDFNDLWKQSDLYKELLQEIDTYNSVHQPHAEGEAQFRHASRSRQDPRLPERTAYIAGWAEQTRALVGRGFQRLKGDPQMPLTTILGNTAMAFIIGSMFYNLSQETESLYHRGALLFFALLFNAFSAMLEVFSLFESRAIVQKHHQYAFYHPAIDALASIITEMPVKIVNAIFFNITLYFLANLRRNGGNFFFFLLMNFTATLMMSHFFRTIGACTNNISEAMIPANMILIAMVLFTGFVIPKPKLTSRWTAAGPWIDPLQYAFEGLITNEFHNRIFGCSSYLPYSPDQASGDSFICSAGGAKQGQTTLLGDDYIWNNYQYKFDHQWRDWGIVVGFTVFFLFTYMLVVYLNPGERTTGEVLVFPRAFIKKVFKARKRGLDAETAGLPAAVLGTDDDLNSKSPEEIREIQRQQEEQAKTLIESSSDIFYWKDVCYDIKIKKEPRRLLNYVDGWVKPGTLTALMGSSGAGKTTLLDTLANRVTMGVVTGSIFVNGIPRDDSFQRTTGYAMQQDLHLETSTVREAMVFSALLRQPASVPRAEKIQYVDNVLKILEMEAYADAVVGVPGKGLNVEQRKRLTIGVEMAAKPKLLLFLDEPTSGLDSQTAWSVCQLMKKLSNAGQAILCTIHQPSALLLSQFDRLLFLAKGGRTVYFGEIGDNCRTLTGYFEKYGADPCPDDANPAEWMLSVIGAAPGSHAKYDYADIWLHSPERLAVRSEIDRLMSEFNASDNNVAEKTKDSGEFAASIWQQCYLSGKRNFQMLWRSPMYIWPKIGLNAGSALFNGLVFFKADTSQQGMQDLMFSVFMFTVSLNAVMNAFVSVFAVQRNLFEARERPSKIFGWKAFLVGAFSAEIPWQILVAILSFVSWYYPAGLYNEARYAHQMGHRGGLTLFYCILFYLWVISLGFMLGGPIEDPRTAANISVLMYTMTLMFSGVLVTRKAMPGFWQFMYRVSPMQYWISGMLALAIANAPVKCAENEWSKVSAPDGMTCQQYFQKMFDAAPDSTGYLRYPNATGECSYCSLKSTNQYLATIESSYDVRWRKFGYMWAFIAFNFIAAIFLYWLARVPKSKSRTKKVDYQGRDVALENAPESDSSKWPPALQDAQGKPFEQVLTAPSEKTKDTSDGAIGSDESSV
nr:Cdr4 [Starmerella bombicola]